MRLMTALVWHCPMLCLRSAFFVSVYQDFACRFAKSSFQSLQKHCFTPLKAVFCHSRNSFLRWKNFLFTACSFLCRKKMDDERKMSAWWLQSVHFVIRQPLAGCVFSCHLWQIGAEQNKAVWGLSGKFLKKYNKYLYNKVEIKLLSTFAPRKDISA